MSDIVWGVRGVLGPALADDDLSRGDHLVVAGALVPVDGWA